MTKFCVIAAAAAAVAFALTLSPASARPCDDDNAACSNVRQMGPMVLDHFMKTWKPVGISKRSKISKKTRTVRKRSVQTVASKPADAEPAPSKQEATVAATPPAALLPGTVLAAAAPAAETDGVAVPSFNEANELAAASDHVQIVAFNEVNEIDLAAPPPPPAPAETVGQMTAPEPAGVDYSWIGKLLLAAAGTLAVAGATRLLLA